MKKIFFMIDEETSGGRLDIEEEKDNKTLELTSRLISIAGD